MELAAEATSAPSPFVVGIEIENQTPQRVVKHGELGAKGWAVKRGKWGKGKRQCGGGAKGSGAVEAAGRAGNGQLLLMANCYGLRCRR